MVKVLLDTDAKLALYELLFWRCGLSAVSGVTRRLGQEGKRSWKRSIADCRGVASNTQKNPEKWRWIRMWMAILKPWITNKYSEKRKKILKTKRILKLKHKSSGGPSCTFIVAGRRGQFAPPAAAGRPKHRNNFHWLFAGVEKILEIPSFDKKFSSVPSKIFLFLSLLHSIGIQLIPVEFWLPPHQWCQAAGALLLHLHQCMKWMIGRCLQI